MAPDADKVRQRHPSSKIQHQEDETKPRVSTLQTLKSNEVAIDGIIYDIASFDHPGGEAIHVFGGNDATAVYRMIHPYHTSKKHLEKMKQVGTISDYVSEYQFDTPFEREVKEEVWKIVRRGQEFGTPGFFFRVACFLSLWTYLHYLWVTGPISYTLAIVYGVSQAFIGLSVQHDANHGAASRKYLWINDLLGFGADLIGGCKYLWMEKHWTHHAYTNHKDRDPDGFSAEPFLLFNDYPLGHPKRTLMHAYQALWFVIVLAGYWISSVFNLAEVWDVQDRGALNVGMQLKDNAWISSRAKFAFPLRLYYLATHVVIPLMVNGVTWTTWAQINVMGIAGSLALGLLFTLSHNFETAERDPTEKARGGEPVCWFKAQVETSSTYGGMIAGWLTGGLNFQIEHHLFPRMSSAWYPYIAPTVRRVCAKHGVKYVYYPWIWQNMISTIRYTHAVGNGTNWKPLQGEM